MVLQSPEKLLASQLHPSHVSLEAHALAKWESALLYEAFSKLNTHHQLEGKNHGKALGMNWGRLGESSYCCYILENNRRRHGASPADSRLLLH